MKKDDIVQLRVRFNKICESEKVDKDELINIGKELDILIDDQLVKQNKQEQ